MESDYRLEAESSVRRRSVLRCMPWVLLSGMLAACGGFPAGSGGTPDRDADGLKAEEKLAIIVNLAVGEGAGADSDESKDSIAAATDRVMERLKAAMSAEDLAAVQTFGSLPAMALSADGALIARLLAMPEVASIELDRELQPLDGAASERTFD